VATEALAGRRRRSVSQSLSFAFFHAFAARCLPFFAFTRPLDCDVSRMFRLDALSLQPIFLGRVRNEQKVMSGNDGRFLATTRERTRSGNKKIEDAICTRACIWTRETHGQARSHAGVHGLDWAGSIIPESSG
jgi:hypothetical protein